MKQDLLIHQPFESFDGVLEFLREAVQDAKVVAIKLTIYRLGTDSPIVDLLIQAVNAGIDVTVIVELKARFDEEANIQWAEQLERKGAQVVFGVVGLKTHAKMLLVTRREGKQLKRYAHLSTGNYNAKTSKLYTDISFLTADPKLTSDVDLVFNLLANQSRIPRLAKAILAPFSLHKFLIAKLAQLANEASNGKKCRVVLKMNALTDQALAAALVQTASAGCQVDLIIRGACILQPGTKGQTENIRVRSIIGRFLEHSRILYFQSEATESIYLSSADWMNRNMLRRIEIAWPIESPDLIARLKKECIDVYLSDSIDAWDLAANGKYVSRLEVKAKGNTKRSSAQNHLMMKYASIADT